MSFFSSLKPNQREAVGLLQIGTFLEYFDLMLYVHLATLLNGIFFPATDTHTAALLIAFAFCSTYLLRPFGALLFGYIGDHIGRKITVIMTTFMMAISCIIIANAPTYAQIGVTAAWIITLCRITQGLSSMGEIIGAEIYLTEITRPPLSYPVVGLIALSSALGSMCALILGTLVTTTGFNWRVAFWIGAAIAMVGSVARTRLRETPEFSDMKRRLKKVIDTTSHDGLEKAASLLKVTSSLEKEKVNQKTSLACFFIQCGWPVFFYFSYMYGGTILKESFGYTPEQIIHHNLIVSIVQVLSFILFIILSCRIYPLKLLKFKVVALLPCIIAFPFILTYYNSPFNVFLVQSFCIFFILNGGPAMPIVISYFPVFRRFTYNSFIYALSRAIVYVITSFGLVYLTAFFGHWGMWIIMIPTVVGFTWSIYHYEKLEKTSNPQIFNKIAHTPS